jgi:hypothetical protein
MTEEKQELIAQFEKNSIEQVRIHLQTWKAQRYVDIRVWKQARPGDGEAAAQPTHKGLTLCIDVFPDLITAVEKVRKILEEKEG